MIMMLRIKYRYGGYDDKDGLLYSGALFECRAGHPFNAIDVNRNHAHYVPAMS
jgi:hypothetical protein